MRTVPEQRESPSSWNKPNIKLRYYNKDMGQHIEDQDEREMLANREKT